jgi:hypothetical protein
MNIKGLSASGYSLYEWCPWKFYLIQVLGFSDESGVAAIIGTMSHHILEILSKASIVKHDKNSKIWNPEYLWNIVYSHYASKNAEMFECIDNAKFKKVAKGLIELINGEYSPITDKTIGVEISFNIPILDKELIINDNGEDKYFNIRGRIDRIDKINDSTIEIIDYKSGVRTSYDTKERLKKNEISLREEIQPRLYHMAARHLFPHIENVIVTFIYFTDGGAVSMPFSDDDFVQTRDMIKRRFFTIKNNEDPDRNVTWKCRSNVFF